MSPRKLVIKNVIRLRRHVKAPGERTGNHRRNANKTKQFSKSSNFSASSNVKEAQPTNNDHCPLASGTHKIWNCPLFKNMSVNARYCSCEEATLMLRMFGKRYAIKECKVNFCSINGRTKKHNRLLHSKNLMDDGIHAVNVNAATISQSNEITSFLPILPVSIQNGNNRLNAYALLDSGSTVSFNDQRVNDILRAKGTNVTLNIAGIHGTKVVKTEMEFIKTKRPHSKVHLIEAFVHPSISFGTTYYD